MVLLKANYEEKPPPGKKPKAAKKAKDDQSTSNAKKIANLLIKQYRLKARSQDEDYLFEGSGSWMDPGQKIIFPDDLFARFK